MNNQGTQKNPVRKAKTSGQIRRPLSHRVMSMLLTFLMVFTTVMPYTAFAEDSVLTDGAGDMELVGVSSGANGTEAEIVDASGDGESSLITDQADASSASGAQGAPPHPAQAQTAPPTPPWTTSSRTNPTPHPQTPQLPEIPAPPTPTLTKTPAPSTW